MESNTVHLNKGDILWKENGEKQWNNTWMAIRKRGDLTCHGTSIPPFCSMGICDNYPHVKICSYCKTCPCKY